MVFVSFFLLVSTVLFAQTYPRIDLELKDATLKNFFTAVENKTDYTFVYSNLDLTQRISIEIKKTALDVILKKVLTPKGITYTFEKSRIILNADKGSSKKERRTVMGTVTDVKGEPLIGASVMIKGSQEGAITDIDGNFQLAASAQDVLKISYMGYVSQQLKVGNSPRISARLQEDTEMLEEVVVIGYGTARKIDLTGSTSSLGGEKLKQKSSPQLSSQLQGQMAGVQITRSNGDPTQGSTIRVRGITTLSENNPLVIIDGVPGNINDVYPFADPVAIICNDEGKLMGLPLNRALRDENGQMYDAVAGTFLVVGLGEEDFASLSPELAQKYEKQFHQPETFLKLGNRLLVIPVPDDAVKSAENKVVIKPPAEHDR